MPALPTTVAIACPRCNDTIECTLVTEHTPDDDRRGFHTLTCHIPDLAERMTAHYETEHN